MLVNVIAFGYFFYGLVQ